MEIQPTRNPASEPKRETVQSPHIPTGQKAKGKVYDPDAIQYHTEEEITKLLSVIDSVRDKCLFTLAYNHGMRISEPAMLTESDILGDGKQLKVGRLKRGRIRVHELRQSETRLLREWMKIRGSFGPNTPIFLSQKTYDERGNLRSLSRQHLDRLMKRYGAKAGLDPVKCYFHTLRHSCGVHMVNAKIPIIQIRDWLGHRNIKSTLVYAKVSEEAMKDTARTWANHLDKVEGKKPKSGIDWRKDRK